MSRLSLVVALIVAAVLGGIGASYFGLTETRVKALVAESQAAVPPAPPALGKADVEAIVADALAKRPAPPAGIDRSEVEAIVADAIARIPAPPAPAQSVAQLDAATLNPMIESYLLANPRILQRVSDALQTEIATAKAADTKAALAELKPAIYDDPSHIVLGNPKGDVTLVEMFDYNCGYCRQALPDLATLMDEDPNLRVILKEFPILTPGSVEAARVGVLVSRADVDYWAFHQSLFSGRTQADKASALKAAADLGLNPVNLEMDMEAADVTAVLDTSYTIARKLKISGTPTYIIGDEVIPGAVGIDELRSRIANMRACGATACPAPAGQPS